MDDGEDGDIILHEYGHAIHDDQVPGWGKSIESGAMGEGFGDYLGAALRVPYDFHNSCHALWDATSSSSGNPPCVRRLDGAKHYPEDMGGDLHDNGEIWSAALWCCIVGQQPGNVCPNTQTIAIDTFNIVLLESQFSVPIDGSFHDAVVQLFAADQALYAGGNSDIICQVMVARGFITQFECPGAPAGARYESHLIDDSGGGKGDAVIDPGESIVMPVTLRNLSAVAGLTNVRATLSSDQPAYVNITGASAAYGNLAADSTGQSLAPHYDLVVSPSTPCATPIVYTLDITSDEWFGSGQFSERVGVPIGASSADPPIAIPDNSPSGLTSTLPVAVAGAVASVSCTVHITHSYIGDLVVTLVSPRGTQVTLHRRSGGAIAKIDRTYPAPTVPDGPGAMGDFAGQTIAGDWRLVVSDLSAGDSGTLVSWSLNFGYACAGAAGCASSSEIDTVKAVKLSPTSGRLSWPGSADVCHAAYRVYSSPAAGMRPAMPPGTWPTDPAFAEVSAADGDGSDANPSYDWSLAAGSEYLVVVDVGTDGGEGRVGHFGQ